jgi:glycosyltransferase involved in cell wall biosynthesis
MRARIAGSQPTRSQEPLGRRAGLWTGFDEKLWKAGSMQVALLHYSAPPIVGGVESVLAHQARLLADAGHSVTIVAGRGEQTDPRIPFVHLPLADSRHAGVLKLKADLDAGSVPPGFETTCHDLADALGRLLAGMDVLIAHNICSLNKNLALTAALHRLNGKPGLPRPRDFPRSRNFPRPRVIPRSRAFPRLILWHHDLAWTTPRYRPELHDGYPWDLLRTAWPGATQVVVSELRRQELAHLMGLPPEAITVVPNGMDLARFYKWEARTQSLVTRMRLLESDPILLLPVRVTPRKNIELALRTLAELRRDAFPQAALVVTGPLGPHNVKNLEYFEQLQALRAELKLQGAAHFLAELTEVFLPDEVIADFYRLADALFLPSREEGFGIPALEAGLSRMPVFCSDIPPLRALCAEDASYFAPDADPRQVAALIAGRLRQDPTARWSLRARQRFAWERIYAEHIAPLLEDRR